MFLPSFALYIYFLSSHQYPQHHRTFIALFTFFAPAARHKFTCFLESQKSADKITSLSQLLYRSNTRLLHVFFLLEKYFSEYRHPMNLTRVYRGTLNTRLALLGWFKKLFHFPRFSNRFFASDRCSRTMLHRYIHVGMNSKHKRADRELRDGAKKKRQTGFQSLRLSHVVYSPQKNKESSLHLFYYSDLSPFIMACQHWGATVFFSVMMLSVTRYQWIQNRINCDTLVKLSFLCDVNDRETLI